jgi:hypothetical protein
MTVQEQLIQLARDLAAGATVTGDRAREVLSEYDKVLATDKQKERARVLFGSDEVEVDEDALSSKAGGGELGYWVQGWLWCSDDEEG